MKNWTDHYKQHILNAILGAIFSAILFGLSTPFAKKLTSRVDPILLAGLLYLGSGSGLMIWIGLRKLFRRGLRGEETSLSWRDFPWLAATIISGGMIAPVLLMLGLTLTPSSTAALLLNFENVCTFFIAWTVFREGLDRNIFIGAIAIVFGGILLSWSESIRLNSILGPILIALACLAWGIDNNLTRRISSGDPVQIAAIKGIAAGFANITVAFIAGRSFPSLGLVCMAGFVGFLGYGLSLVFFILALRNLGAARTSAYFAMAPFIGAIASFLMLGEKLTFQYIGAAALIIVGIYLHISERHAHEHIHHEFSHEHRHRHDEHHNHAHDNNIVFEDAHAHWHRHSSMIHSHPHYPDIHHRHIH